MRTKALVLTAALGILGTAGAMAQVYSQNAVGFYTVNLVQGFNLVANQLNNGDNTLDALIPATSNMPDGSTVLKWDAAAQTFEPAQTFFAGYGWFDPDVNPSATTLGPGQGAFVQATAAADVVLVGEVPQGTGANALTTDLVPGFQIVSQQTPQQISFNDTGFPAADGDTMLFWDKVGRTYAPAITFYAELLGWYDGDLNEVFPTPAIGEAVFYQRNPAAGNVTWTREFSVNP